MTSKRARRRWLWAVAGVAAAGALTGLVLEGLERVREAAARTH